MSSEERSAGKVLWTQGLSPEHFFRERVLAAQERQHVSLPENVEFYLVQLLCDFVKAKEDPTDNGDCLALVLKKALESSYGERVLLYKHIGDTALYMSGFFKDSLNRKAYDLSYYAMMGESAYQQLAHLMTSQSTYGRTMAEIYAEISEFFSDSVEVLMDVSEQTTGKGEKSRKDLLNLYSQWAATESKNLERQLLQQGIFPVSVDKDELV